jgi:uncharacterized Zn-binding protein involved in type VI secretion
MFAIRSGDVAIGVCPCPPSMCPSTGIVASGDPMSFLGGQMKARQGDVVIFPCGSSIITAGSQQSFGSGMGNTTNSSPVQGAGQGIIASGFPNKLMI